jgi:hypothetical protein
MTMHTPGQRLAGEMRRSIPAGLKRRFQAVEILLKTAALAFQPHLAFSPDDCAFNHGRPRFSCSAPNALELSHRLVVL